LLIIEIKNNFARGNCKKLLENYYNPTWSNFMKKQIIAKINNIANELDRNGLYAEANSLTNVMKKLAFDPETDDPEGSYEDMFGIHNDDPESDIPVKDGMIIVQPSGDRDNPYQSSYTVYVRIEGEIVHEISTFTDENGKIKILHDRDKANEVAKSMRRVYPDVSFRIQLSEPKKYNPMIPDDFEREERY
jgi:hypothetical protein